ncbi:COMM domain-containing protein 3 [Aplochiton taeniatus]
MELSESTLNGLQSLADPSLFDLKTFTSVIEIAFSSLLCAHSDSSILDVPEFRSIDQALLKQCHAAATTCILEGVKQNVDKSSFSSCLEDVRFEVEKIEIFYTFYLQNKGNLETVLSSLQRCPPHINDVSWRLEYNMKNGHVHKVNEPSYLISLNVENAGLGRCPEDIHFNCTMEQLQDLVGKMKDAAKGLEKATQM